MLQPAAKKASKTTLVRALSKYQHANSDGANGDGGTLIGIASMCTHVTQAQFPKFIQNNRVHRGYPDMDLSSLPGASICDGVPIGGDIIRFRSRAGLGTGTALVSFHFLRATLNHQATSLISSGDNSFCWLLADSARS